MSCEGCQRYEAFVYQEAGYHVVVLDGPDLVLLSATDELPVVPLTLFPQLLRQLLCNDTPDHPVTNEYQYALLHTTS